MARLVVSFGIALPICDRPDGPPASAQILYGSVVGIVKDSTGAIIPGATVTIVNKETNLTREATTNAEGAYSLINVLPGPYDVKVSLTGFREVVRHQRAGHDRPDLARRHRARDRRADRNHHWSSASRQLLQTDKADVHTELKSAEITAMPLNRFRNYQALINLVPGTTPMAFGNAETDTPARSLATNVNGQANTNNSTRTDGATNMNIWLPNHNMYVSPAETIDTVNMSTSSFDAEQGMAGGAAVTVVTKSGTNQFRGSAFEFYNSDKLNAKPYFFGAGAGARKLPVKANIYGGTVGGPITQEQGVLLRIVRRLQARRRACSRSSACRTPRCAPATSARRSTPTARCRQIYNPLTGDRRRHRPQAVREQPDSGEHDQPDRAEGPGPVPDAEQPGIGAGGLTNNYQRQEDRTVDRENYDAKVNWNRTSAHQIWGKFSHMNAVVDDLTNYLGPDPNADGDGGNTKVYQFTAGQTWTLSPTLLMDTTFGFSRQKQDVLGPDFNAGNFGLDMLGIPGTNDQGIGDQRYAGYPEFRFGGTTSGFFSQLGNRDGWNPIFRDERTYSLAHQHHEDQGPARFPRRLLPELPLPRSLAAGDRQPARQVRLHGEHDRRCAAARRRTSTTPTRRSCSGYVGQANKSVQNELMTAREWQHALYFRDRWTPTAKLTLDLGLRWELYPIMHRADGRGIDRLDLDNPDFAAARRDHRRPRRQPADQRDGGEPGQLRAARWAAIYRINDKTVFRSGYGITYNAHAVGARDARRQRLSGDDRRRRFLNAEAFGTTRTLQQGIPAIVGPDQSSGRVPLDRAAADYTPEIGNIDRGYVHTWNIAVERRLPLDIDG